MGGLSFWHIIIVIMVIFLLFGRGRISDLMGDVAKGIKSFKKNMSDEVSEDKASKKKDSNSKLDH